MNNHAAAAMQAMHMPGVSAAPRLRSTVVRASWTAMPSCSPAFGRDFGGHVSFLGLEQTQATVIAKATKNPAYDHRQPEESLT